MDPDETPPRETGAETQLVQVCRIGSGDDGEIILKAVILKEKPTAGPEVGFSWVSEALCVNRGLVFKNKSYC